VKETVEQVIREKEGEIRRMRAMWNESVNANIPPISDEDFSNDLISRATKYLTVQELTPENKNARFGISAEDRISKTTPVSTIRIYFVKEFRITASLTRKQISNRLFALAFISLT